jgi:hypothetical protein
VNPLDYALLAKRAYTDAPTVGKADSASRMCVYGDVHAFRGTDDLSSVIADADCALVHVPGLGALHAGFYGALAAILPAALALRRPVAVTGHSLGAAMAIIYAAVLAQLGHVCPVYAFEPPRIAADDTLAHVFRDLAIPFYGTRNGNDLVTQVPLGLMCPRVLTRIGKPALLMDNLIDHSIDRVIDALQELETA